MKTILIVGACGRIGSELTKKISNDKNLNIVLADFDKKKLLKIKKNNHSKNIETFSKDLTKEMNIKNLIRFCIKKFKRIDTTIYCMYPKNKKLFKDFEYINENSIKDNLWNLLGSLIIFSKMITQIYKKQKFGNLILISSILGVSAPKFWHYKNSQINCPVEYSTSKAGIIHLTKYLAKLFSKENIRVNCISPGGIKDKQPSKFIKKYKKSCGKKGLLDATDIIGSIQFLMSDKSKYIRGQNLIVDDGWSL